MQENSTVSHEDELEKPFEGLQGAIKKIDVGKASIVVFMLTAALCALIGAYSGYTFAQNEANEQLIEFFDTHTCVEGTGTDFNAYSFSSLEVEEGVENDK